MTTRDQVARKWAGLFLLVIMSVLAGCVRLGPPRPEVAYQADVRIAVVGRDGEARAVEHLTEFCMGGLRRRQATIEGVDVVAIDRPDLNVSWLLDPEAKAFQEFRLKSREIDALVPPDPFGPRVRSRFRKVGMEEVGGRAALRYEVDGDRIQGVAWTSQDGVPIRFEGEMTVGGSELAVEVEYGEVQRSPQALYLFAIPPNYAGFAQRTQPVRSRRDAGIEQAIRRLRDEREWRPSRIY